MSALEIIYAKGWGRVPMPGSDDSTTCHLCREKGKQFGGDGTKLVFLLGRPFHRVCKKCADELEQMWDGALNGGNPAP